MLGKFFRLLLLLAFLGQPNGQVTAAEDVEDYCLADLNDVQHCASEVRGKWLVINFWATWCPPCIKEIPELQRFYEQNHEIATLWGVSFEDRDKDRILEFVERLGVTYPILGYQQDPLTGYGVVKGLPTTFVIGPDGLLVRRFEGLITSQELLGAITQK